MIGQASAGPVLAVDIGGTKLAAALVDHGGRAYRVQRAPTPQGPRADAEALWVALDVLVTALLAQDGTDLAGVGVGCGGPMVWPAGLVSPLNLPGWRDFPLLARMTERLP